MSDNIKLSISLLASDRAETLEKCLKSLMYILDNVESELIVVFTGEDESVYEICTEYATEVVRFIWINDFAAARNAGLSRCRGQWFMFLDDDEWFEDTKEIVDFFKYNICDKYNSASYIVRNYSDYTGLHYSDARLRRIARREESTIFRHRVHEMLYTVHPPEKMLNSYVHHYGYAYRTEEDQKKHYKRNRELLLKELEDNPDDIRAVAHLVNGYVVNDIDKAEAVCLRVLDYKSYRGSNYYQWVQCKYIEVLNKKNIVMMYDKIKEYVNDDSIWDVTRLYILYYGCVAAQKSSDIDNGIYMMEMYERIYERLLNSEENNHIFSIDNYYNEKTYILIMFYRIEFAFRQGDNDKIAECISKINWEHCTSEELCNNAVMLTENLIKIIYANNMISKCNVYLSKIMRNSRLKECVERTIDMCDNVYPEYGGAMKRELEIAGKSINSNKILLTISIILSDRFDTAVKCLESVKKILKLVDSELIITDTSGNDDIYNLAIQYTDRIIRYKWNNDFAAARNIGLKSAKGSWFMYIDDDEWFENVDELVEFFNSGEYLDYDEASYVIRNYTTMAGDTYGESEPIRLYRIYEGIEFTGRIHEHIHDEEEAVKRKRLSCYAHHYGYVYESEDDAKKHSARNLGIMERVYEEHSNDLKVVSYLLNEYRGKVEYAHKLIDICKRVMSQEVDKYKNSRYYDYIISMYPCGYIDDPERQIQAIDELKSQYKLSEYAHIYIDIIGIRACDELDNGNKGIEYVEDYISRYKTINEAEDKLISTAAFMMKENIRDTVYNMTLMYGIKYLLMCGKVNRAYELGMSIHVESLEGDDKNNLNIIMNILSSTIISELERLAYNIDIINENIFYSSIEDIAAYSIRLSNIADMYKEYDFVQNIFASKVFVLGVYINLSLERLDKSDIKGYIEILNEAANVIPEYKYICNRILEDMKVDRR